MGPINMVFFLLVGLATTSLAINCPGCPFEEDVNSVSVANHLKLVLKSTKASAEGVKGEPTEVLRIIKATTQVVSGLKHTYDFEAQGVETQNVYQCHLVVYYQPWAGVTEVMEYTCKTADKSNRNKRAIPGGEVEMEINDETHLPRIKEAIVTELNKQVKSNNLMGVVKFVKASRQVVSGNLFRVKVEVAETDCPASSTNSLEKCTFQQQGHQVCDVEVHEKLWLHEAQVSVKSCTEMPRKCRGCPIEQDANSLSVANHLEFVLKSTKASAEGVKGEPTEVLRILRVTTQVVSGLKHTYDFEAEGVDTHKIYKCHLVEVYKPWTGVAEVLEYTCQ